jgi:RND superfamily putative drug exporter
MAEFLYKLGKSAARRAWVVIGSWALVLALTGGAFATWAGTLATSFDIPGLPSSEVVEDLADGLPDLAGASGTIVYRTQDGSPLTASQRAQISELVDDAGDLPDVSAVNDPFEAEEERAARALDLEDGQAQLDDARAELRAGQEKLDAGAARLDAGQAELDAGQAQLDAAREQAEAAGLPTDELDAQQAQLDAQRDQLGAAREDAEKGQAEIDEGRATVRENAAQLDEGTELLRLAENIRLVSEDGSTARVNVAFDVPRLELQDESKQAVVDHFTAEPIDGVEAAASSDISQGVPSLVGPGEVTGLLFAAVVLLVMLGTVLGAGIPIVTALTGVVIGALGALSFSGLVEMASVTPVLGLMLGLAVGIDYSLFIPTGTASSCCTG